MTRPIEPELFEIKVAVSKALRVIPLNNLIETLEKILSALTLLRDSKKVLEDFIRESSND